MINLLLPIAADLIKDHFKSEAEKTKGSPVRTQSPVKNQLDIATEMIEKGMDNRPFWKRKTFWSMAIGVLVPIMNKVFDWNMDVTEITATISPLLIFIATEQWKKK